MKGRGAHTGLGDETSYGAHGAFGVRGEPSPISMWVDRQGGMGEGCTQGSG